MQRWTRVSPNGVRVNSVAPGRHVWGCGLRLQPLRIEAYFVQHAGKENDAGRFNVVAAGRLSIHFVYYFWSFHPPDSALSFQGAKRECKQPGVEKKSNY